MHLQFYQPQGILGPYIELFTYYEGFKPDHKIERLLPEGVVEIIIDMQEIDNFIYDNDHLQEKQTCKYAWISGLRKEFISISAIQDSSMTVIRFRPGMAYPFLGIPVNELNGLVIDADLILKDIGELREKLIESVYMHQRFHVLQEYFLAKLLDMGAVPGFIRVITKALHANPSSTALSAMVEMSGYSHKHFIQLFKKYIGIPPKQFMRIMKFQQTLATIEQQRNIYWPDIAYSAGYYDQAHFIHEFKAFSGFSPSEYLTVKGPTTNYIPIA